MTSQQPPQPSQPTLQAIYTTQTNTSAPFTLTTPLSPPTSSDPAQKTAYLSRLRGAVISLQDQINHELTARMEEDKAREAAEAAADNESGGGSGKGKGKRGGKKGVVVDDEKEEENYGEEVQEEDD